MCPGQLLVTMDQVSVYTGIYNYVAKLNGAPYYAQNDGPGYVYKYTNDNNKTFWQLGNNLGTAIPSFYSNNNTECPEEANIWYHYLPGWIATPGFNVDVVSRKSLRYI